VKKLSEEYDLKKSKETIGQLYPILEAKDGEIIDGFHREEADKNWKRVRLEHIDTEEKKAVARIAGNRRAKTDPEYAEMMHKEINRLAEIYQKQGLVVGDIGSENQIVNKISEVTGLHRATVTEYLDSKFKQKPYVSSTEAVSKPKITASTRIEHELGKEYVERHREEVLAEEKPKIEQQVKAKLLKSPEFQREVIQEIHKEEAIAEGESCPILSDDVDTPDESITPMPANPKTTLTITCPKCGFKFEF